MTRGVITDVHRTSTVDGPGIRTTVFTKGCPLRCLWCHNPETQRFGLEAGYGREVTVDEVTAECRRDRPYYKASGGGVTLSGGEPLSQSGFSLELLGRLKAEGIHTVLDTSGFGSVADFDRSLAVTDLYLWDYKVTDPRRHRDWVGAPQKPIVRLLERMLDRGACVILRCPVIPGLNDGLDHWSALVAWEQRYPHLMGVEVLPWHTMGNAKYAKLGRVVDPRLPMVNVPASTLAGWRRILSDLGAQKVTVEGQ